MEEAARSAVGAARAGRMSLDEARNVLGVDAKTPLPAVYKRFQHLFVANEKVGSFYLQSKVFRAKEALEVEHGVDPSASPFPGTAEGTGPSPDGAASDSAKTNEAPRENSNK